MAKLQNRKLVICNCSGINIYEVSKEADSLTREKNSLTFLDRHRFKNSQMAIDSILQKLPSLHLGHWVYDLRHMFSLKIVIKQDQPLEIQPFCEALRSTSVVREKISSHNGACLGAIENKTLSPQSLILFLVIKSIFFFVNCHMHLLLTQVKIFCSRWTGGELASTTAVLATVLSCLLKVSKDKEERCGVLHKRRTWPSSSWRMTKVAAHLFFVLYKIMKKGGMIPFDFYARLFILQL